MQNFYSNGKLLITAEYLVLDGAISFALPTKFGQSLKIEETNNQLISWKSYDDQDEIWFENLFLIETDNHFTFNSNKYSEDIALRIVEILKTVKRLNPNFTFKNGLNISTKLNFPRNWGLGTSSTLINNIATWTNISAYKLLKNTFGGSGYDIACAQHDNAILYQLERNEPIVKTIEFKPTFYPNLYFVYLNRKQNSRDGIANYNQNKTNIHTVIPEINNITYKIINSKSLFEFQSLMNQHEKIISKIINLPTVKSNLFSDFNGAIKSLGAWGGDFILVAAEDNPVNYFKNKGFDTIIPFSDMIL